MQVEYTGRQTEVTPKLKALAERRLRKLAKVLRTITHAHVILTADKHRQIAEVTVHSPQLDLSAQEVTGDMTVSLGNVLDKLERQAQKRAGKRQERRRRGPARGAVGRQPEVWPAPGAADGGRPRPRLIRSRGFVPRPMTVEEAVAEVEGSKEGLLVFRDAATERMSVLFRRKDGNLGLIEPEA